MQRVYILRAIVLGYLICAMGFAVPSYANQNYMEYVDSSAKNAELSEEHEVDLSKIPFNNIADDLTVNKGEINGNWSGHDTWESWMCRGFYHWATTLSGRMADLSVKYQEDNSLAIYGDLRKLVANLNGGYQGDWTGCNRLNLSQQIDARRAVLRANAKVYDVPNSDKPKVTIRIQETSLEDLDLHLGVLSFIQDELTFAFNETMNVVWSTEVGKWISDYIAQYFQRQRSFHVLPGKS